MATRKSLTAIVDWCQVLVVDMSLNDIVINLLGIPIDYFNLEQGSLRYYQYDCCYRFGDVRIYSYYNGQRTDKMIVLGGLACKWYREEWLKAQNLSFKTFLSNLLVYEQHITVTRLDVAIDDFNQPAFFTPLQLAKLCKKKQFVYGKSTSYLLYGDENTGATLYLKPPNADDRLKIYDKQAETAKAEGLRAKDLPPQIRTEVLFRRDKAHEFFLEYVNGDKPLLFLFQGYLKDHVRFYSDKHFKVPLKKWQDFLGSVESFSISIPKQNVTLFKKIKWLEHGGGLAIYKAIKFLIENDLLSKSYVSSYKDVPYPSDLANELKKFVARRGRADLIKIINSNTKTIKIKNKEEKECD